MIENAGLLYILIIFAKKTNMVSIESAISDFVHQLQIIGFTENSGALLLQLNFQGQNYIKSSGNLNNLNAAAVVLEEENENTLLIEFMNTEIEQSVNADSTKKLHRDTLKLIKVYSPSIPIQEVTSTYLQQIEVYMRKEKGLATNTIGRHMKVLKSYINIARRKEIISKYPFLNYTIRTEKTQREGLTESEIETLQEYRDSLNEPNEVLNAFLFSCYTGLRYSDIRVFTKQQIYTVNRKKWIITRMVKTNSEIRIPLSTIFEGRALHLTKSIPRQRGLLFHLSNNQQVNRELKRIARSVGIKKDITFHTARHTCATLLLYRGVSITTVQKILGHQSVKTTQIYSAVTDLTLEKELKRSNRKTKKR